MSDEIRNLLAYLGTVLLPPVADAVWQAVQAQTVGGKPIDWGQIGIVALVALLGAFVAASRPRVGATGIASQVDALKESGVQRRDMVVIPANVPGPSGPSDEAQTTGAVRT